MNDKPKSTALLVREWLLNSISESGFADQTFTYADVNEAIQAEPHPVCAELSKMRQQGIINLIGRREKAFLYRFNPNADLTQISMKRPNKPKEHARSVVPGTMTGRTHAKPAMEGEFSPLNDKYKPKSMFLELPTIKDAPFDIVGELLSIGIAVEESGATRETGLRLLKVAEHVFRSVK